MERALRWVIKCSNHAQNRFSAVLNLCSTKLLRQVAFYGAWLLLWDLSILLWSIYILKKFIVLILSFLYLTASVGATVHLHFCMDKLIGWSLGSEERSACSKCGMHKDKSKGCCKDEHKQVKLQGEQKVTNFITTLLLSPVEVPIAQIEAYKLAAYSSVAITYPVSHAPPQRAFIPVYLSNRTFRI